MGIRSEGVLPVVLCLPRESAPPDPAVCNAWSLRERRIRSRRRPGVRGLTAVRQRVGAGPAEGAPVRGRVSLVPCARLVSRSRNAKGFPGPPPLTSPGRPLAPSGPAAPTTGRVPAASPPCSPAQAATQSPGAGWSSTVGNDAHLHERPSIEPRGALSPANMRHRICVACGRVERPGTWVSWGRGDTPAPPNAETEHMPLNDPEDVCYAASTALAVLDARRALSKTPLAPIRALSLPRARTGRTRHLDCPASRRTVCPSRHAGPCSALAPTLQRCRSARRRPGVATGAWTGPMEFRVHASVAGQCLRLNL